jgi:hypothetical protein
VSAFPILGVEGDKISNGVGCNFKDQNVVALSLAIVSIGGEWNRAQLASFQGWTSTESLISFL